MVSSPFGPVRADGGLPSPPARVAGSPAKYPVIAGGGTLHHVPPSPQQPRRETARHSSGLGAQPPALTGRRGTWQPPPMKPYVRNALPTADTRPTSAWAKGGYQRRQLQRSTSIDDNATHPRRFGGDRRRGRRGRPRRHPRPGIPRPRTVRVLPRARGRRPGIHGTRAPSAAGRRSTPAWRTERVCPRGDAGATARPCVSARAP
jgi:hypothetical protein